MLPMGSIMAASMLLGVAFTNDLPVFKKLKTLPKALLVLIALLVLLSGLWNVFWYASRHLGEFWGNAALVSGILMIITSAYTLLPTKLPSLVYKIKPMVLLGLFGFSVLYSVTIYQL